MKDTKIVFFITLIFFFITLIFFFFCVGEEKIVTSTPRPVKEITVVGEDGEGGLYQSLQTDITIEHVHGHFILRDSGSKKLYTFVKKRGNNKKSKLSYIDTDEPNVKMTYDRKKKKVVYNNNTFKKINNVDEVLNLQIAIEKVRHELKQKENRVISGSNIRLTSKDGRLYYKIKVRSRNKNNTRIYRVYSDDGHTVWTNKK